MLRDPFSFPIEWWMRRLRREAMRFSPEGRSALSEPGTGSLTWEDVPAVLAALRGLPDGADATAVAAALAAPRPAVPPDPEGCWFCGRPRAEQRRLIAGGKARICEDCARSAAEALASPEASDAVTEESARCDFCGRWSGGDAWLVGGEPRAFRGRYATVCDKCVPLCIEILNQEP